MNLHFSRSHSIPVDHLSVGGKVILHFSTLSTTASLSIDPCAILWQSPLKIFYLSLFTQRDPIETTRHRQSVITKCTGTQINQAQRCTAKWFTHDPEGLHFYTGLENYQKFVFVLSTLGPAANELMYFHGVVPSLPVEDQFFVTLIKLHRKKTNFELSRMFAISQATVTNIFVTWINFMTVQWGETDWWPSRDLVSYFAPTDFKLKFPATRVVVDGTECPIQKPKQPIVQQATFSTYKNKNTVKVLVGMTPGGLVSYLSPAYGGSASDRQICEPSNLRQTCDPGDSIMADKGFNVQDLFESRMVTANIPTFFRKRNRMSGGAVLKDRKIASKRVHVERVIGLAKTYNILKQPMNNTESALASQIIKVCFYLCSFRSNIVPKDA